MIAQTIYSITLFSIFGIRYISYLIHDLSVLSLHCVLCIFANLDCMFVVWLPSHVAFFYLFDTLPEQKREKNTKKCKNEWENIKKYIIGFRFKFVSYTLYFNVCKYLILILSSFDQKRNQVWLMNLIKWLFWIRYLLTLLFHCSHGWMYIESLDLHWY